jgi:hypothetical protein
VVAFAMPRTANFAEDATRKQLDALNPEIIFIQHKRKKSTGHNKQQTANAMENSK